MLRKAFALVILIACARAGATTLVPLDLKALATRADRVVLGTVEKVESRWTDDHDAIYTDVSIRVARVYKGALKPGDLLMVRREGGSVGGIGMRVYGAANFQAGEEVVVFVEQRGAAAWAVGMGQGKLRVTTLPTGEKRVAPTMSDAHFTSAAAPMQPRALDDFERELRSYVRSGK